MTDRRPEDATPSHVSGVEVSQAAPPASGPLTTPRRTWIPPVALGAAGDGGSPPRSAEPAPGLRGARYRVRTTSRQGP